MATHIRYEPILRALGSLGFEPYSGGTIYPVIANPPPLYGSKPTEPSARQIGSYLMWGALTAARITRSVVLSALAPNLLALALVKSTGGIYISWGTWV
ncbi:anion permease, partial [Enterobacter hormaechei]|uniref:anion permease n=1 Tax=Enterobacter hormaechei TaxID=158836 RepID=UPI003CC57DAB